MVLGDSNTFCQSTKPVRMMIERMKGSRTITRFQPSRELTPREKVSKTKPEMIKIAPNQSTPDALDPLFSIFLFPFLSAGTMTATKLTTNIAQAAQR